ncbi:MAG: hypothetical protein JO327_02310 [Nitrososphaeraceae archaeon]|nr:hypothetical protein [Nitrososphaeraceae archaeon]
MLPPQPSTYLEFRPLHASHKIHFTTITGHPAFVITPEATIEVAVTTTSACS